MFTFGFYNAMNHDRRYNAEEVSSMFDGIILDGIYMHVGNRFIVKSKEELDDTVVVGSGRAWFNHTWSLNDADTAMKGPKSDVVKNRIDAIVIDVDTRDLHRKNQLLWLTGPITGSTPTRPTLIKSDGHYQYPLCYIERRASSKVIHQADITNMVGTTSAPFVTGVLQGMDIDDLIAQWQDQWHRFVVKYQEETIAWRDEKKAEINRYITEWRNQMDSFNVELKNWTDTKKQEFMNWFVTIENILDENAAGHLYNMITEQNTTINQFSEQITEKLFLQQYDLVNGTTTINESGDHIVSSTDNGTATTDIGQEVNSTQTITTVVVPKTGSYKYTKTTTITVAKTGTTVRTSYTRSSK